MNEQSAVSLQFASSNSLAVLASDIQAAHRDVCRAHEYSAERAVDAGRWLMEAKASDSIPRGGWDRWVEQEAGISQRTARHYIKLYIAVSEGTVTLPDIAKAGQVAALKAASCGETERGHAGKGDTCSVADLATLVSSGARFGCIYADPPWLYSNQSTRAATDNHYDGMTVEDICALPIGALSADAAHLHLWITNGFLFEAPRIFQSWGFEFRTSFVWIKRQMGIGNYWRNSHELLLTAIRGDATRFDDHSMMSWLECDRGPHSEKPEEIRSFIERASGGPYLELFARRPADGWTVWGNEIERNLFSLPEVAE